MPPFETRIPYLLSYLPNALLWHSMQIACKHGSLLVSLSKYGLYSIVNMHTIRQV